MSYGDAENLSQFEGFQFHTANYILVHIFVKSCKICKEGILLPKSYGHVNGRISVYLRNLENICSQHEIY
jgi:hypothetical protein